MGKLIAAIAIVGVLFMVAMNTSFLADKSLQWVDAHSKEADAPKVMFWAGWWCDVMSDSQNAEKMYWLLYQRYPQENALVAEAMCHLAELKADGPSRITCLDYCKIVLDQYPSEEKWRFKASKLYDQVKNNVR